MKDFEKDLDTLSERMSKTSALSWIALFFGMLILVIGIIMWTKYTSDMNARLDKIEMTLAHQNAGAGNPPAGGQGNGYESRLSTMESLIGAISTTSSKGLEQMNFIFVIVASFFGLFSAFYAVRQFLGDTNKTKHDNAVISLVGSFRENIGVVNSLMETFKESFSYKADVDKQMKNLKTDLDVVADYKKNAEKTQKNKIIALNQRAISIFNSIDRENFKQEENKRLLENFYDSIGAVELTGRSEDSLGAFGHYVRGLHYFNLMQYELAGNDIEKALKLIPGETGSIPGKYPDLSAENVTPALERLREYCPYQLGIIYYNTGDYGLARGRFTEVLRLQPSDFRSRIYIPELMFFDSQVAFADVIKEFGAVRNELDAVPPAERSGMGWEYMSISLLMKFGNCYLKKIVPLDDRLAQYQGDEDNSKAANLYFEAYELIRKKEGDPSLQETFLKFSLAQSLTSTSFALSKRLKTTDLYEAVFHEINRHKVYKTEPILLMLLNYIQAICAWQKTPADATPAVYLDRARDYIKLIPVAVRIFSPVNKINLDRENIRKEMEQIEKMIATQKR